MNLLEAEINRTMERMERSQAYYLLAGLTKHDPETLHFAIRYTRLGGRFLDITVPDQQYLGTCSADVVEETLSRVSLSAAMKTAIMQAIAPQEA